ncbi:MAG: hypothetical protein ABIH49_01210 [archaeon]
MKNNETIMWILIAIAVIVVFSGFGAMRFGSYGYGGMRGMMYGGYGSGMMFFGWLYGILILVALVLFIVWLFKQIQNPKRK